MSKVSFDLRDEMFQFQLDSLIEAFIFRFWYAVNIGLVIIINLFILISIQTRRERLKSALYLRLKKRKTFWKKIEIFEKKILPKKVA